MAIPLKLLMDLNKAVSLPRTQPHPHFFRFRVGMPQGEAQGKGTGGDVLPDPGDPGAPDPGRFQSDSPDRGVVNSD